MRIVIDLTENEVQAIESEIGSIRDGNEKPSYYVKKHLFEMAGLPVPMKRADYLRAYHKGRTPKLLTRSEQTRASKS